MEWVRQAVWVKVCGICNVEDALRVALDHDLMSLDQAHVVSRRVLITR